MTLPISGERARSARVSPGEVSSAHQEPVQAAGAEVTQVPSGPASLREGHVRIRGQAGGLREVSERCEAQGNSSQQILIHSCKCTTRL